MHWLVEPESKVFTCTAKTRYRQSDQACEVTIGDNDLISVTFDKPQKAVTPGQFVVLYQDELCLGGGVICRSE